MEGKDLLLQGVIWRVGTGSFIDVRDNPWLLSVEGYRLRDPYVVPANIQCVSHLILENPVRRDGDPITTHFSERDTTIILELPLTQSLQEDTLFWQLDTKGYFTVKSASNWHETTIY